MNTTKNTISIGTQVHNDTIMKAKLYLKDNFSNKYDLDPHLNFVIMAMPFDKREEAQKALDDYFSNKSFMKLQLGVLTYEPKSKFFSLPIVGEDIMSLHKDLLNILNPIRGDFIREKDLVRMNEGKTDALEDEYIKNYGYLRVLDKFTPHITIGNIQDDTNFNLNDVTSHLNSILGSLYNNYIPVDKIYATLIEDADIQSEYKWLWEKEYIFS